MSNSDMIDIAVTKHAETKKAVLVSETGRSDDAVWLPKSQIEIVAQAGNKALFIVTLPEWLAKDKEFI